MGESRDSGDATQEIEAGARFEFGENWRDFVASIDEAGIAASVFALKGFLGTDSLAGLTFLDAGCGSGLSSLAARRLGAAVTSFDFDPASVSATVELRGRFGADDENWRALQGSVLDPQFLDELGTFDIVYSWGVLHHTGQMWTALDLVAQRVKAGGRLYIAIYNDQGGASTRWRSIKRTYNRVGPRRKRAIVASAAVYFKTKSLLAQAAHLRLARADANPERGMSHRHDLKDWVGGYPFEVAKPEEVFEFLQERGFALERLKTCAGGLGCNEFVFVKGR